jgi:hypothetical protein
VPNGTSQTRSQRCVDGAELGNHPLRAHRDASFIYNHWWNAPIFIWLAEASGVDKERIQRAAKLIAAASGNTTTQAATIRRILPWRLVAKHLRENRRVTASTTLQADIVRDIDQIGNDRQVTETVRQASIAAQPRACPNTTAPVPLHA